MKPRSDPKPSSPVMEGSVDDGLSSLIPAYVEAERLVKEGIRYFGLNVPRSRILVTIQSAPRSSYIGWFAANRWTDERGGHLHEIVLAAERLRERDPAETLLHELVHAENFALGIKDTAGDRHNLRFKKMAERIGLLVNEKADSRLGFGITRLGPDAEVFINAIAFRRDFFSLKRKPEQSPPFSSRRRNSWWECACGVCLPHARADFEATCGKCGKPFERKFEPEVELFEFGE